VTPKSTNESGHVTAPEPPQKAVLQYYLQFFCAKNCLFLYYPYDITLSQECRPTFMLVKCTDV